MDKEKTPLMSQEPTENTPEIGVGTSTLYKPHKSSQRSHSTPGGRRDFQVAIICALPLEASIVSEIFDRRFDEKGYGKTPEDTNSYTLGAIGDHNVVLVHMPDMGKVAAATAAGCLHASFQNIDLALVVGICGGAPFDPYSKKEILIGDVIISEGLIQYDLGRRYPHGFLRKDTPRDNLPRPSPKIRSILAKLKTIQGRDYLEKKSSEYLGILQQKLSSMVLNLGEGDLLSQPSTHFGLIASGDTVMKSENDRDSIISRDGVIGFEMEGAGVWEKFSNSLVIKGVCDYADSCKNKKWQDYAAATASAVTRAFLENWSIETPRGLSSNAPTVELEEERSYKSEKTEILRMLYKSPYLDRKDRNQERVSGTCEWFIGHKLFRDWQESPSSRTLWVSADPGCGKSVLAKYLIDHVLTSTKSRTTCYFFFKDDFEDQRSVVTALCCILHQLFTQRPGFLSKAIFERFQATGEGFTTSFHELWNSLISAADESGGQIVCIFDAIDECEDDGRSRLSQALRELYKTKRSPNLKFLLTSRPYSRIRRGFRPLDIPELPVIHLSGEGDAEMEKIALEIDIFIKVQVHDVGIRLKLTHDEQDLLMRKLMRVPNRTYLWLRLTFDLIQSEVNIDKMKIIKITSNLPKTVNEAYERILAKSRDFDEARKLLQIVIAASRPLTLQEMNFALAIKDGDKSYRDVNIKPEERFREDVRDLCGLIVIVVDSKIYLLHQTVKEFLIAVANSSVNARTLQNDFEWKQSLRLRESHSILAETCVQHLFFTEFTTYPFDTVPVSRYVDDHVFLDYSAKNWATHVQSSGCEEDGSNIRSILELCNTDSDRCRMWLRIFWTTMDIALPRGFTSLITLSYFGFTAAIQRLLESEYRYLNARDYSHGRSALSWAAGNGFDKTVDQLLKINASWQSRYTSWWGISSGKKCVKVDSIDKYGRTPLVYAVWTKNVAVVKLLLKAGARIALKDSVGGTPLSYAICSGCDDIAGLLLKNGAEVGSKEDIIRALLFASTKKGDADVVELLLGTGIADPNLPDDEGMTPLSLSIAGTNERVLELLLKAGAQPDSRSLSYALEKGNEKVVEVVELLLKAGAQPDSRSLLYALEKGNERVAELLLKAGAQPDSRSLLYALEKGNEKVMEQLLEASGEIDLEYFESDQGWELFSKIIWRKNTKITKLLLSPDKDRKLLSHAVRRQDAAILKLLLSSGPQLEFWVFERLILLSQAVGKDKIGIIEALLQADIYYRLGFLSTKTCAWQLFIKAAKENNEETCALLLKAGARPNLCFFGGRELLRHVLRQGNEKIMDLLLKADGGSGWIDLTQEIKKTGEGFLRLLLRDDGGWLLLWHAVENNEAMIVEMILQYGAPPQDFYVRNGRKLLLHAINQENERIVELLLKNGAPVDIEESHGWRPLARAIVKQNLGIVQLLLSRKVELNFQYDLRTPLSQAAENGDYEIVRILVQSGASVDLRDRGGLFPVQRTNDSRIRDLLDPVLQKPEARTVKA